MAPCPAVASVHSVGMPAVLDTRRAHLVRAHGDVVGIYTWINDERALVLAPAHRPGAPWYCVLESAAYTWDDSDPRQVSVVAQKAAKACSVLGIEPTPRNCVRLAGIIIDGLPDLIRMPSAPPPQYRPGDFGQMTLRADGADIAAEPIRIEQQGAEYE